MNQMIAGAAPRTADDDAVLRVENLTVGFGRRGERQALRDVSFTVKPAEVVAMVGESGCGKSLTALSVMGLLPPEAKVLGGSVIIDGHEIAGKSEGELQRYRGDLMSMIFQDALVALNPLIPVGRQVDEVLRIHTGLNRQQRRAKVIQLFEAIGIPDPANRVNLFPHEFSGGLRQRVMIAMAVINEPKLIIADEPTTALDVTIQAQILEVLGDLAQSLGTSVLFITHDMGVVAEIADRVLVMYGGRLVEDGDVVDVFNRPAHPYTHALLQSVPRPDASRDEELPTIPGSVPAPGAAPEGCPFRPRCKNATDQCLTMPPMEIRPATGTGSGTAAAPSPEGGAGHQVACWNPMEEER